MKSKNLLFKKSITGIANSKNLTKDYKPIAKLDENDYLVKFYSPFKFILC